MFIPKTMWSVFIFALSISLLHFTAAFNETECTTDADCRNETEGAFCTDSGVCAEGPSFKCPENMHYASCGSTCPKTCDDVLKPNPSKICTAMCVAGCFCDEGYALDKTKKECVPEANCQKEEKDLQHQEINSENATMECPENAEFSDCTNICPEKHCGNLLQPSVCFSLRCGPPGCRCKEGHILKSAANIADGCVKIETCPDFSALQKPVAKRQVNEKPQDPRCPQNAEFKECTNVCGEKHCGNILMKTECVSLRCGPAGCQCKAGHVRLNQEKESACVRRESCQKMRFRRFLKL